MLIVERMDGATAVVGGPLGVAPAVVGPCGGTSNRVVANRVVADADVDADVERHHRDICGGALHHVGAAAALHRGKSPVGCCRCRDARVNKRSGSGLGAGDGGSEYHRAHARESCGGAGLG